MRKIHGPSIRVGVEVQTGSVFGVSGTLPPLGGPPSHNTLVTTLGYYRLGSSEGHTVVLDLFGHWGGTTSRRGGPGKEGTQRLVVTGRVGHIRLGQGPRRPLVTKVRHGVVADEPGVGE